MDLRLGAVHLPWLGRTGAPTDCGLRDISRWLADSPARRPHLPRSVQIAARHADPRTTMRYDRARKNPGRHPNNILAAHMASGT
jgi:hypothetical protein